MRDAHCLFRLQRDNAAGPGGARGDAAHSWTRCGAIPSSVHHVGRRARVVLDDARERGSEVLKCKPSEVVFTSGGTESANLAIFGAARLLKTKGRHIITSSIEHHAVLHCCEYLARKEGFEVTCLPVDREGLFLWNRSKGLFGQTQSWCPLWQPITKLALSNLSLSWGSMP